MDVKKRIILFVGIMLMICLTACGSEQTASVTVPDSETNQENSTQQSVPIQQAEPPAKTEPSDLPQEDNTVVNDLGDTDVEKTLHFLIDDTEVSVAWNDNESVSALIDLAKTEPLIIEMSMYGGFEQVGSLGSSLPRNDEQTTTEAGDIVLYSGDQIVVFYGSNAWAYTRLGKITDKTAPEMADLLSNGNVSITITYGGK